MDRVRRKNQTPSDDEPFYRYIMTVGEMYLVEYCGIQKRLPRADYERVPCIVTTRTAAKGGDGD